MFLTFLPSLDSTLSLLWQNQAALGLLIQVMPFDLWIISSSGTHTYMTSANWMINSASSIKIRKIGIRQAIELTFCGAQVSRNVLEALVEYRPVLSDLLPNLQWFYLCCERSVFKDMPFLQCLLGLSVLALHIFIQDTSPNDCICSLFWSMSQTLPHLQEISIVSWEEHINPENSLMLSGLLLSLSEVKTIQMAHMPLC